jgi:hypothetical protein
MKKDIGRAGRRCPAPARRSEAELRRIAESAGLTHVSVPLLAELRRLTRLKEKPA